MEPGVYCLFSALSPTQQKPWDITSKRTGIRWMDGWLDGWMDGQVGRWTDRQNESSGCSCETWARLKLRLSMDTVFPTRPLPTPIWSPPSSPGQRQ